MPRCLVKQPDGLYAVWSSVLDELVRTYCSKERAVSECVLVDSLGYPGGLPAYLRDLATELDNIERTGRAWDWAPTWDEAQRIIRGESLAGDAGKETKGETE